MNIKKYRKCMKSFSADEINNLKDLNNTIYVTDQRVKLRKSVYQNSLIFGSKLAVLTGVILTPISTIISSIWNGTTIPRIHTQECKDLTAQKITEIQNSVQDTYNVNIPTGATSEDFISNFRDVFYSCFAGKGDNIVVKSGYEDFYIDCRHNLINDYSDTLNSIHQSCGCSFDYGTFWFNVGSTAIFFAVASTLVVMTPTLISYASEKLAYKKILNEAKMLKVHKKYFDQLNNAKFDLEEALKHEK